MSRIMFFMTVLLFGCQSAEDSSILANRYLEKTKQAFSASMYDSVMIYGDRLIDHASNLPDKTPLAETYYYMGYASALKDSFERAKFYAQLARDHFENLDSLELKFRINSILSWSNAMTGTPMAESFAILIQQKEMAEALDDNLMMALVYNNYAYDGTTSGYIHLDTARHYAELSNKIYAVAENHEGRWYTLMNLAWIAQLKPDLKMAKYYGQKALARATADSDRHAIIEAAANLGTTYLLSGDMEAAGEIFNSTKHMAHEKTDRDMHVFNIYYADYLRAMGKTRAAIDMLAEAALALSTGEIFYESMARTRLAAIYLAENNKTAAREQLLFYQNPRADYISVETRLQAAYLARDAGIEINMLDVDSLESIAKSIGMHRLPDSF